MERPDAKLKSYLNLLLAGMACFVPSTLFAVEEAGNRYAVIVGINDYEHAKLREPSPLKYSVADATASASVLRSNDFEVNLLTDEMGKRDASLVPNKVNIEAALDRTLGACQKNDTVVVALAGHGLQFSGQPDAFFCPRDARPFADATNSLISIRHVYSAMDKSFAGVKVILVDACRNDPDPGRGRGLDADSAPPPPKGVGGLFSCSAGQRAFEHDSLKHGVFFYYVLQGLLGKAANSRNEVTFQSLSDYVATAVPEKISSLFPDRLDIRQIPNTKGDVVGSPRLVRIELLTRFDYTGVHGHGYFRKVGNEWTENNGIDTFHFKEVRRDYKQVEIYDDSRQTYVALARDNKVMWRFEKGDWFLIPGLHDVSHN